MEVSTIVNQSTLCNTPDGPLLHVLKEPELVDEDLRHRNNSVQEQSQNSEVGNIMTADSVLLCNGTAMEDPLVTVLNGDYCGLGTQIPIEYLDIFEILRAEVLAAEAREIEVIENGFLNSDESPIEFQSGENEKGIAIVEHEVPGSIESSVSRDEATTADGFALPQDDVQEESRQTDILDSPKRGFPIMQAQLIDKNGQAQLGSSRAHCQDAEGIDPDTEDIEPSGHGQTQLRKSSAHPSDFEETGPDERDVDPSDNGQPQLESPSSEVTGPKKGDGDSSDNAQVQLGSLIAYPNEGNAELSASGKGEDGDGCVQNGTGAENVEAAPGDFDKGVLQHEEVTSEATGESGSIADRHQNIEEAGNDGNSHILIVEVTGDAEGIGISKDKSDNGDGLSQSDKHSEHSEDEDPMSSAFSGPIAFSGMLSYSGMISYSGQIPYSGNLSLHSDSSASTRSFAFPVLASDWNSSPTKIGPPDSRYFRRRRRWRPRFCCRRPTTLFD